jgi:hypothetical protein
MADFEPAPLDANGFRTLKLAFSRHARTNIALRDISVADIERALREGVVLMDEGGSYVIRADDPQGRFYVSAERSGDSIVVRTALREDEIPPNAG